MMMMMIIIIIYYHYYYYYYYYYVKLQLRNYLFPSLTKGKSRNFTKESQTKLRFLSARNKIKRKVSCYNTKRTDQALSRKNKSIGRRNRENESTG